MSESSAEASTTGGDRSSPHDMDDMPRMEPWLRLMMIAFVPVVLALVVPRAYAVALFVTSGVIMIASIALLLVQERAKRRRQT
jgi:Flp pilus assembly protein TadB